MQDIFELAMDDDGKIASYCSQTFVILDRWLNAVAREKGDAALKTVKNALETNIKANITYYESIAEAAESSGQNDVASENRQIARIYKGLLD